MKPEQPLPLEKSLRSLRHLSSVSYCFKPADPSLKAQLSPELQQHRCGYCLAVKADPRRMQACIEADDGRAAAPFSEPRRVECPFGVQEWLIPIWHDDTYQGCLFVGEHGGNPDRVPSGLEVEFQSLTREEHGDAAAVGRVFQELYLRHLEQGRTAALLQQASADEKMLQAMELIRHECRINLRVEELARAVHLSPSRFLHRFKDCMGQGVRSTLREVVMEKGHHLVTATDLSILQISEELGYANQNHFAQHFKARFNCSATTARRQARRPGEEIEE